jgi:hypothetical protein
MCQSEPWLPNKTVEKPYFQTELEVDKLVKRLIFTLNGTKRGRAGLDQRPNGVVGLGKNRW